MSRLTSMSIAALVMTAHVAPIQGEPPAAPRDVVAVINRGGCGNCHVIPGVPGADGEVGPDLTKLGAALNTLFVKKTRKQYDALAAQ